MSRTKMTLVGFILSSLSIVAGAAVTETEWKFGKQCLEAAGLPPHNLLCLAVDKNKRKSIMRAGFMIGTKTRQTWCSLVDKLGLRAEADDALYKEGMADSDDYDRAFQRAGEVVQCLTEKVFTDYNQWGLLATHMYYCGELDSHGDCIAAVKLAKELRGKEPECKATGSLWRWTQGADFMRLSLDSIYKKHCVVKATKMQTYCETIIKDKTKCQSLYGTTEK
ncbi:conserved hypothetical protein, secreted [Candidatus Thiomargarita nelsonii]|uniref:Secreted protein n=1 Tax=Candidatus Thiomargarita nelsonii TaxID=1003181 RepID=A0A176S3E1_9GAMM|nr:conserved hypothetical protein, secreted [Candidatus Thiomargarita nelsonii]